MTTDSPKPIRLTVRANAGLPDGPLILACDGFDVLDTDLGDAVRAAGYKPGDEVVIVPAANARALMAPAQSPASDPAPESSRHAPEAFCACGRVASECDGSRVTCPAYRPQSVSVTAPPSEPAKPAPLPSVPTLEVCAGGDHYRREGGDCARTDCPSKEAVASEVYTCAFPGCDARELHRHAGDPALRAPRNAQPVVEPEPLTREEAHAPFVAKVGSSRWRAECPCGWHDTAHAHPRPAQLDAEEHAKTLASSPALRTSTQADEGRSEAAPMPTVDKAAKRAAFFAWAKRVGSPSTGILATATAHPPTLDCPSPGCYECSVRDCPSGDPLHYDKDGCPACTENGDVAALGVVPVPAALRRGEAVTTPANSDHATVLRALATLLHVSWELDIMRGDPMRAQAADAKDALDRMRAYQSQAAEVERLTRERDEAHDAMCDAVPLLMLAPLLRRVAHEAFRRAGLGGTPGLPMHVEGAVRESLAAVHAGGASDHFDEVARLRSALDAETEAHTSASKACIDAECERDMADARVEAVERDRDNLIAHLKREEDKNAYAQEVSDNLLDQRCAAQREADALRAELAKVQDALDDACGRVAALTEGNRTLTLATEKAGRLLDESDALRAELAGHRAIVERMTEALRTISERWTSRKEAVTGPDAYAQNKALGRALDGIPVLLAATAPPPVEGEPT